MFEVRAGIPGDPGALGDAGRTGSVAWRGGNDWKRCGACHAAGQV